MIKLNVINETMSLKAVLVGIADDFGGTPKLEDCYDPKSKEHVIAGTFPNEQNLVREIDMFSRLLEKYGVKVFRPQNIKGVNQIFSRDIAFVIEDKLLLPNIITNRKQEAKAIDNLLSQIPDKNKIIMPENTRAEGGDVMPWNEYIFVGYSSQLDFEKYTVSRTNKQAINFLT